MHAPGQIASEIVYPATRNLETDRNTPITIDECNFPDEQLKSHVSEVPLLLDPLGSSLETLTKNPKTRFGVLRGSRARPSRRATKTRPTG